MALPMARAWKHPKTHVYYFRRAVPQALRAAVGKREEKRSLRTKDPDLAKSLHARMALDVEARWKSLSVVRSLDRTQCEALAGDAYRRIVAAMPAGLGSLEGLKAAGKLHSDRLLDAGLEEDGGPPVGDFAVEREQRYGGLLDEILRAHDLRVDDRTREHVLRRVVHAVAEGRARVAEQVAGDYGPDVRAGRFPAFVADATAAKVSIRDLWERYLTEAQLSPSTIKRWRPCITSFIAHVEDRDAALVTAEQVVRWKEALFDRKLDPITIRDVYLASLKAVYGWAVANKKVASSPVAGIKVAIPKSKAKSTRRGFTMQEAETILSAALVPCSPKMSKEHAAARRWVPWICAYSGARVNEITQLRGLDIAPVDGIWAIRITPEAGSTKSGEARHVPLHPHLIEQGLVAFATAAGEGPLFYAPERLKNLAPGHRPSVRVGQRLAEWVRRLGITDPAVDPNHGWRHLFKTLCRRHGLTPEEARAIQGHAPQSEAERYGAFELDVLAAAVDDLPRFGVAAPRALAPARDAPSAGAGKRTAPPRSRRRAEPRRGSG